MTIDEAINVLRWLNPPRTSKKAFDNFMQARDIAIKALEKQRWIPVEDRLPEPWTLVLVTDSCKNVTVCQMALNPSDGWYDECENWMYFSTSVIAWMPLPEYYQKGEQE